MESKNILGARVAFHGEELRAMNNLSMPVEQIIRDRMSNLFAHEIVKSNKIEIEEARDFSLQEAYVFESRVAVLSVVEFREMESKAKAYDMLMLNNQILFSNRFD